MNPTIALGDVALAEPTGVQPRPLAQTRHADARDAMLMVACCLLIMLVLTPGVLATESTGGAEFTPILDWLVQAAKGGLGKLIAMASFVGGMLAGIVKGSLWGAGIGIGFAICMYFGPDIILGLFGMTL